MDLGVKNKVALVAGGSMGLGKAVAMRLSGEGAKVAIGSLDDAYLPAAAEEIRRATGGEVLAIPADVTDLEQAKQFVRRAVEHFGTVDILVNNAGGPPSTNFLEIDDTLWEYGFRLNLMSTIVMTREAVPVMKTTIEAQRLEGVPQEVKGKGAVRRDRPGQVPFQRAGALQHHGQQRLPRLHADRPCPESREGHGGKGKNNARGHHQKVGIVHPHGPSGHTGRICQPRSLPGFRTQRLHHRRRHPDRRRVVQGHHVATAIAANES